DAERGLLPRPAVAAVQLQANSTADRGAGERTATACARPEAASRKPDPDRMERSHGGSRQQALALGPRPPRRGCDGSSDGMAFGTTPDRMVTGRLRRERHPDRVDPARNDRCGQDTDPNMGSSLDPRPNPHGTRKLRNPGATQRATR